VSDQPASSEGVRQGAAKFGEALCDLVNYWGREYHATHAELVGNLVEVAHDLMHRGRLAAGLDCPGAQQDDDDGEEWKRGAEGAGGKVG
jgi:hypothetical protein